MKLRSGYSSRFEYAGVVCVATTILLYSAHGRSTFSNTYILLADALRHGHLYINWPGRIIDAVEWGGKHWVIDGPLPALFALPLVFAFGTAANQTTLAISAGIIATALAWYLLYKLGVQRSSRLWLTLFFFAGTDLWWCAELGDTQFLAHIVAVCCTLGAIVELVGKQRGWVVGTFAIGAVASRFPMIGALPFYALVLPKRSQLYGCMVLGATAWIIQNEIQWGQIADLGHNLFYNADSYGSPLGSALALNYLPYELYSYFLRAPTLVEWLQVAQWPYLRCEPSGIALTFTSPALALAFLARRRPLVIALWLTVALVSLPDMLYYLNGWYQFGMRHALDFEPFLLVLMALGVRNRMPLWGIALCAWSAMAGVWGVWYWGTFYRTGD